MTKLVLLFFLAIVSPWVNAQTHKNYGENSNDESSLVEKGFSEKNKATSTTENNKDKSIIISSAARRSTLINNTRQNGETSTPSRGNRLTNPKSLNQARRPTSNNRPVQVNIPVLPVPGIAKPNRMTVPNRRVSLPIGKS
ncbi:MAG TPA: hypothetical protein VK921_18510 [Anditalea sp.]|nr:hypothetical protein [Anditalea sp.]